MKAGDMLGASLCLERAVATGDDPSDHLKLSTCYHAIHREAHAAREAIRALSVSQASSEQAVAGAALDWIATVWPEKVDVLTDAVLLNHRPESADTLYELLWNLWKDTEMQRSQ
jgi:hypothetical protein